MRGGCFCATKKAGTVEAFPTQVTVVQVALVLKSSVWQSDLIDRVQCLTWSTSPVVSRAQGTSPLGGNACACVLEVLDGG